MKIGLSIFGFCLLLFFGYKIVAVNSMSHHEFASSAFIVDIPKDLLQGSKDFLSFARDPQGFTLQNCSTSLDTIYRDITQADPTYFDASTVKNNYKEIIRNLFYARLEIRKKLKKFVESKELTPTISEPPCVTSVRNINRASRYLEDYLGENFMDIKPYDEKSDPKAYGTFTGNEPWLLKADPGSEISIRSGDIIVSRGNAFTSAAIARISPINAQFSHLAMIYVIGDTDGHLYSLEEAKENPNVVVLEAHIEVGSTVRTFKDYLQDGNARNVQFRLPDSEKAHAAAEVAYRIITEHRKNAYESFKKSIKSKANPLVWGMDISHPDFSVPYDFKMDLENYKEVFCSEVGYLGFKAEGITLPLFPSTISPASENDLVGALGVKGPNIFAPGDMELDTRFEMLAEWRDFRKMKAIRYKDAILDSMFSWMKEYGYKLDPQLYVSAGASVVWMIRWVDFPKIQVGGKVIFDVSRKLPKNMTPKLAAIVATLNKAADVLGDELERTEKSYRTEHPGLLLVYKDMLRALDLFRERDFAAYKTRRRTELHSVFHPSNRKGSN
jgi:hypothetical protein